MSFSSKISALVVLMLAFSGCYNRKEIEAAIFLNDGLPVSMCGKSEAESKNPELWKYGFFRKLNDRSEEFIPYCDPSSRMYFSIYKDDLNRILDANVPEGK